MGMTEVKRDTSIRPWASGDQSTHVDVFCSRPGSRYGIGLAKQDDGSYEMVSDWSLTGHELPKDIKAKLPHSSQFPGEDRDVAIEGHGVAGPACREFRGLTKGLVTKHTIRQTYSTQGFMVQETEEKDGSIRLRLSR